MSARTTYRVWVHPKDGSSDYYRSFKTMPEAQKARKRAILSGKFTIVERVEKPPKAKKRKSQK